MAKIYGVAGRRGHGKDTFASAVKAVGKDIQVTHFADALKTFCHSVFGLTQEQMHDPVVKEAPLATPICIDDHLPELSAVCGLKLPVLGMVAHTPRELMQFVGTEYVRSVENDYWLNRALNHATSQADSTTVLIADTRFVNEAKRIQACGGKVIKVLRTDFGSSNDTHKSEVEIDQISPDLLLGTRTGDLTLVDRVARLVAEDRFVEAMWHDYRTWFMCPDIDSLQFLQHYYRNAPKFKPAVDSR